MERDLSRRECFLNAPSQTEGLPVRADEFRWEGFLQHLFPQPQVEVQARGKSSQKDRIDGADIPGQEGERRGIDRHDLRKKTADRLRDICGIGRLHQIDGRRVDFFCIDNDRS